MKQALVEDENSIKKYFEMYAKADFDDEDTRNQVLEYFVDKIYVYKGVRIMGLGGSIRYKKGKNQYTQKEMNHRINKMWLSIKKNRGFDILLTHSPAAGIGDGPDEPHKGFEGFNYLLEKYKPKYFIHGHIHKTYQMKFKQEYEYNENTKIINGYERYILEYPDA